MRWVYYKIYFIVTICQLSVNLTIVPKCQFSHRSFNDRIEWSIMQSYYYTYEMKAIIINNLKWTNATTHITGSLDRFVNIFRFLPFLKFCIFNPHKFNLKSTLLFNTFSQNIWISNDFLAYDTLKRNTTFYLAQF